MKITLASKNDLKELGEIYAREFVRLNIGENWTADKAEQMLNHFLGIQPDIAFVASDYEKIIGGMFGIIKPWWDGNHLSEFELFVDSEHHGKTVGKQLLRKAIEVSIDKYQISSVDGVAYNDHPFPLSWYRKMGFVMSDNLIIMSVDAKKALVNLT